MAIAAAGRSIRHSHADARDDGARLVTTSARLTTPDSGDSQGLCSWPPTRNSGPGAKPAPISGEDGSRNQPASPAHGVTAPRRGEGCSTVQHSGNALDVHARHTAGAGATCAEASDGTGKDAGLQRAGAAAPAAAAALPCQESHNCNGGSVVDILGPNSEAVRMRLSKSVLRVSRSLVLNVRELCRLGGIERVGMLTLTTPDVCSYWTREGWREAQRRFNSFRAGVLPRLLGPKPIWVCVAEPQRRGAIHWHILCVCPGDIRTGFDFRAAARKDYSSAGSLLRSMWEVLREACPKYGLGRHELMPIRKDGDALAEYVGKYIGKSIEREYVEGVCDGLRRPRGARRVRYSQGWRVASTRFGWVESGRPWRKALAYASRDMGLKDFADWSKRFGPRWAFHLGDAILETYAARTAPVPEF